MCYFVLVPHYMQFRSKVVEFLEAKADILGIHSVSKRL